MLIAVIFGCILCEAHNTFSFKGSNRWSAGKRAQMDTNGLTDRLTQTTNSFVPKVRIRTQKWFPTHADTRTAPRFH